MYIYSISKIHTHNFYICINHVVFSFKKYECICISTIACTQYVHLCSMLG